MRICEYVIFYHLSALLTFRPRCHHLPHTSQKEYYIYLIFGAYACMETKKNPVAFFFFKYLLFYLNMWCEHINIINEMFICVWFVCGQQYVIYGKYPAQGSKATLIIIRINHSQFWNKNYFYIHIKKMILSLNFHWWKWNYVNEL